MTEREQKGCCLFQWYHINSCSDPVGIFGLSSQAPPSWMSLAIELRLNHVYSQYVNGGHRKYTSIINSQKYFSTFRGVQCDICSQIPRRTFDDTVIGTSSIGTSKTGSKFKYT